MIGSVINDEGVPVEIAPGRGNLRNSSFPTSFVRPSGVSLVDRHLSFARLFASQPMVGIVAGWLLRQQRRVPLKVYSRESDEGSKLLRPGQHKLATAINQPFERGSGLDLGAQLLGSHLVHGNALDEVESGAKESLRFVPADWRFSLPIMPWRDTIAGWELDTDDPTTRRTRGADVVLHIRDWSPLGPIGISPLQQLGVTIAIEDAAQRHQRSQLANGVSTTAAVQTNDDRFFGLDPSERKELMDNFREDVEDNQAGPENAGRFWLMPPGLEVKAFGQTAQEAQLIEQRVVNRTESLGIYGLPPYTAAVIERSVELPVQREIAIVEGLAPPLLLIEACINAQIVTGLLHEPDIYVAYDFSQALRGDRLKEIEAIRDAIATGVKTPNEGLQDLGKPRSDQPGMDDYYLPRNNLWPLSVPYPDKGMGGTAEPSGEAAAMRAAARQLTERAEAIEQADRVLAAVGATESTEE